MPVELRQSVVEAYIRDPVLAAWAIFGVELDVFQRARLRFMWHVPEVIDDSGISTGKTELAWIWAQLRCILLPQPWPFPSRVVGAFYPTLGSAQANFAPKYEKYIQASKLFREQLRPMHGGKLGYQAINGAIRWVYRNGSMVECPAPDYANDAQSMASRRYSDVVIDEAKEADAKSDGLDKQILGRATAPGYNNGNPVWANHIVLMGHAEDPDTHPFYRRVLAFRRLIRDGSQNHAIITSSYKDWNGKYAKEYRPDSQIRRAKLTMTKAAFNQVWGGLWARGSADWYDSGDLKAVCTRKAPVLVSSKRDKTIFAAGVDLAPGANVRADFNSVAVVAAKELPADTRDVFFVWRHEGRAWRIWPCWSTQFKARSAREISGIVHSSHRRFNFSRIVMDPGGGGMWVEKEMWRSEQLIDGVLTKVSGICVPEKAHEHQRAQPILVPFLRRMPELHPVWEAPRFLESDEGIIESIHRTMQGLFASRSVMWPADEDERPSFELQAMSADEREALRFLTMARNQFASIAIATRGGRSRSDGENDPLLTRRGFLRFDSTGKRKKDMAYAMIYAFAAMFSVLKDPDFSEEEADESSVMVVA